MTGPGCEEEVYESEGAPAPTRRRHQWTDGAGWQRWEVYENEILIERGCRSSDGAFEEIECTVGLTAKTLEQLYELSETSNVAALKK